MTTEIDEVEISSTWHECALTFDEMNLKEDLLRGENNMKITHM